VSAISEYVISAASASASGGVLPSRAVPALLSALPALLLILLFSKKRVCADIGRGTHRVSPAGGESCERERRRAAMRVKGDLLYVPKKKEDLRM
jgi:hypothetical protein